VVIYGVDQLAPEEAHGGDLRGWMRAPLGGAPFYRRMLEPIAGFEPTEIIVLDSGEASQCLVECLRQRPYFGHSARLVANDDIAETFDDSTLLFPGWGVLSMTPVSFLEFACRGSDDDSAVVCGRAHADQSDAIVALLPRGCRFPKRFVTQLSSGALGHVAKLEGLEFHRQTLPSFDLVDTPYRLQDLARRFVEEEGLGFAFVGEFHDGVLLGPRAEISPGATVQGAVAVGAESYIAPGAALYHGAVIGEGCYIGEGALISDAVVLDGTTVQPGDFVISTVHGADGDVV